jgi:hypothetical protein
MTQEAWFQSEQGILTHYREQMEHAEEDYLRVKARIRAEMDAMVEALRASRAPKGRRDRLGMVMNDGQTYTIIGVRKNGSFRAPLKKYGFDKQDIDRILDDLDADREMIIDHRGNRFHLRPL